MSKINVSFGRTINLGNYNSARLEASYERDIEPHETYQEAFAKIFDELKNIIETEASKL